MSADELAGNETGAIERLTVNLTPRAQAACHRIMKRSGDTKADTINRAIQFHDLFDEAWRSEV